MVQLVVEGLHATLRNFPMSELSHAVRPWMNQIPMLRDSRRRYVKKLHLEALEQRLLPHLDGSNSVRDLADCGLGHRTAFQLVIILELFGFLTWRRDQGSQAEPSLRADNTSR